MNRVERVSSTQAHLERRLSTYWRAGDVENRLDFHVGQPGD